MVYPYSLVVRSLFTSSQVPWNVINSIVHPILVSLVINLHVSADHKVASRTSAAVRPILNQMEDLIEFLG